MAISDVGIGPIPDTTAPGGYRIGVDPKQGGGLHALDSKTGRELWVTRLNASGSANPMTYQARNGKQYVAVAAGGTVNVFALP